MKIKADYVYMDGTGDMVVVRARCPVSPVNGELVYWSDNGPRYTESGLMVFYPGFRRIAASGGDLGPYTDRTSPRNLIRECGTADDYYDRLPKFND